MEAYCERLASSSRCVGDLIVLDGAGGGVPLHRQRSGGGVEDPQVSRRLRKHCGSTQIRPVRKTERSEHPVIEIQKNKTKTMAMRRMMMAVLVTLPQVTKAG